jgi:deazaflavin-dependent oxidoreductase (nitroreductase family)
MLLLDHVGAKSGAQRTTPLIYMQDDEDFGLFGAKGGHPQNPAWVHNLRAHPNAEVQVGSRRIKVNAREASAEERKRLWPRLVEYNPQWAHYQRRTDRTVPLVILSSRR